MSVYNEILKLARENNGTVTSKMISEYGYSRGHLKYLVETGKLEKVSRGVYTMPSVIEDDFLSLQQRFKKGIFSLETSLYLNGLTDRTPLFYTMSFPYSYNVTNPKSEGIKCKNVITSLYEQGIINIETQYGNIVKCYNSEKTLCDILKPSNNVDIQIITEAFKQYVKKKDKNIELLSKYAKEMKVENKVRSYLEVLL